LREIPVAFFRNLNLGRPRSNSPTSSQLLDAFVEAGARSPSHVGTSANPFIASLVGVPVTTRSITTMRRVADRIREYAGA
jgi:hypothetical protein